MLSIIGCVSTTPYHACVSARRGLEERAAVKPRVAIDGSLNVMCTLGPTLEMCVGVGLYSLCNAIEAIDEHYGVHDSCTSPGVF